MEICIVKWLKFEGISVKNAQYDHTLKKGIKYIKDSF